MSQVGQLVGGLVNLSSVVPTLPFLSVFVPGLLSELHISRYPGGYLTSTHGPKHPKFRLSYTDF